MESFTQDQLAAFFAEVRKAGVASGIGFTCRTIGYMCRVAQAFPDAEIHYDGPVGADILRALRAGLHGNRLTVWVGFAAATPELCALVKRYAALGLWILHSEDQLQKAVESFHADIIETNGEIKPGRAI